LGDSNRQTSESRQSFWEHLGELRRRILVTLAALVAGFFLAWAYRELLFDLVTAPVREGLAAHGIPRLIAIETVEAMTVYLKLAVASGLVLASPVAIYELWAFVRPGLLPREIRPMRRVAVLAGIMFLLGVVFCYRYVLPLMIDFLAGFTLSSGAIDFQVTMSSAYSTAVVFLLGFGLVFELPLVMVLLSAIPLFDSRRYIKWTRYAIVLFFVVAAVFTPPDVLSQFLMAVPLCLLYFVGIGFTFLMERKRAQGGEAPAGIDWPLAGLAVVLAGVVVAVGYFGAGIPVAETANRPASLTNHGCGQNAEQPRGQTNPNVEADDEGTRGQPDGSGRTSPGNCACPGPPDAELIAAVEALADAVERMSSAQGNPPDPKVLEARARLARARRQFSSSVGAR
jgi:sec-independent protein translocase protein TatC